MQHITTSASFREYVGDKFDVHFDCGFQKPTHLLELSDKDKLIKAVWLHYVLFLPYAEMDQMKRGIRETLQLESFIRSYPKEMHCFLVASGSFDVTPDYLIDSMLVRYSDGGSNKHTMEEAIVLHWTQSVQVYTKIVYMPT